MPPTFTHTHFARRRLSAAEGRYLAKRMWAKHRFEVKKENAKLEKVRKLLKRVVEGIEEERAVTPLDGHYVEKNKFGEVAITWFKINTQSEAKLRLIISNCIFLWKTFGTKWLNKLEVRANFTPEKKIEDE